MSIKVIKNNSQSNFPKHVTCPHCTSELEIETWSDVRGERGTQYNESYVNLWINCPVCGSRIALKEEHFTPVEIDSICRRHSSNLAQSYYDK